MKKTKAMQYLDKHHFPYQTLSYESDGSFLDGIHVAKLLELSSNSVYKTIVVQAIKQYYFVMIAVDQQIDLKKLANGLGVKKVVPIHVNELEQLTGYKRGACTVIAAKKAFPLIVDEAMLLETKIAFSAGQRGIQLQCNPNDLITLTNAQVMDIKTDAS